MNKRILRLGMLILAIAGTQVQAAPNMIIAPSPLYRAYAYSHYPFARPEYSDCKRWYVDVWGAAEYRTANSAFTNHDGTDTESLGALFFGAESFLIGDALGGVTIPTFDAISFGTIFPTFDYNETLAYFGMNVEGTFGCNDEWHVGVRARVPFSSIKTGLDSCCNLESATGVGLFVLDNERLSCLDCDTPSDPLNQNVIDAFALRLDLASALNQQQSGNPPFEPLVIYGNAGTVPVTRINGIDVTDDNANPIYLIYSPDGQPTPQFARTQPEVDALPLLNGAGTNVTNARFDDDTDYSALAANPAAQHNFWIAPTVNTDDNGTLDVVEEAKAIRENVRQLLELDQINRQLLVAGTALSFLGTFTDPINFDTQRRSDISDLDVELYGRYDGCMCYGSWFGEGIFGVRFPTSSRNKTPNNLLLVPNGNGRHYEIKLGGLLGWNPCDWFAIKADAYYHWVLRRRQTVAASFVGSTISGIGPNTCANVSWQYFVGDVDFTFLIPCIEPLVGFNVGYQAWVKRRDRVCFGETTAVAPGGAILPIDESIQICGTKRIAHTVKAEIFKQTCDWQIFAGWNHSFAGQNSLKNSDWYLGLEVYF